MGAELYLFVQCSRSDQPLLAFFSARKEDTPETTPAGQPYITPSVTNPPFVQSTPQSQTATPVPTTVPTPTGTPLSSPPPTDSPTPPATATAEPSAPPAVQAPGTASGSAVSDTGTGLNMEITWQSADAGGGITRITVSGVVQSYTLQVMDAQVTVQIAGYSTTVRGNPINIEENVYTETDLFTATLDVPAGTRGTLTATWNFRGNYSGVDLPEISASGYVG